MCLRSLKHFFKCRYFRGNSKHGSLQMILLVWFEAVQYKAGRSCMSPRPAPASPWSTGEAKWWQPGPLQPGFHREFRRKAPDNVRGIPSGVPKSWEAQGGLAWREVGETIFFRETGRHWPDLDDAPAFRSWPFGAHFGKVSAPGGPGNHTPIRNMNL